MSEGILGDSGCLYLHFHFNAMLREMENFLKTKSSFVSPSLPTEITQTDIHIRSAEKGKDKTSGRAGDAAPEASERPGDFS